MLEPLHSGRSASEISADTSHVADGTHSGEASVENPIDLGEWVGRVQPALSRLADHAPATRDVPEIPVVEDEDMLGPFYQKNHHLRTQTSSTEASPEIQADLDKVTAELGLGTPLQNLGDLAVLFGFRNEAATHRVRLQVRSASGEPLPEGTKVHIWHANVRAGAVPGGLYDHQLIAMLERAGYPETKAAVEKYQLGRCAQIVDGDGFAEVEVIRPEPYSLGQQNGIDIWRAEHLHVAVELPDGFVFTAETDDDQNGLFQSQLYYADGKYNEEDAVRFAPNGFDPNRVMDPSSGTAGMALVVDFFRQV